MMNNLTQIMNMNTEWEQILTAAPYNLKIVRDGAYILLKYNQLESDFSLPVVQVARGIIYKEVKGRYECVCHPFHKFFNYGEDNAADIDWDSAIVTEKVDGSLMKVWYDDGWHLSTNGTIDAFKAPVGDFEFSYGELFEKILGEPLDQFFYYWDRDFTYLFEMTSPYTQIVVPYPERIYMLTWIHTKTGVELNPSQEWRVWAYESWGLWSPQQYKLGSLTACVAAAKRMSKDEEGLVVSDRYSKRIKVKSPEYLMAAHLRNNGVLTVSRMLEAILAKREDDLTSYVPAAAAPVRDLKDSIRGHIESMDSEWKRFYNPMDSRKDFALKIKDSKYKSFLFKKYNDPDLTASDWIYAQPITSLKEFLLK